MDNENKMNLPRLQQILSYGGIFVWDISCLCSEGFKTCVQNIFPAIKENTDKFIVPSFALEGLKAAEGTAATMVVERKFFSVYLNVNNYSELLSQFKNANIFKLNLFVNDMNTKQSVIKVGKDIGVFIYCYKINNHGEIENFRGERLNSQITDAKYKYKNFQDKKGIITGFMIKSEPEKIEFSPIVPQISMNIGEEVWDSEGNQLLLSKQEAINNGAITYSTNQNGKWVKIFSNSTLNTYLEAKIERMISQSIHINGLCWPIDIVRDRNGIFRGYILSPFHGAPIHLCVFKRAGIDTYFSNWSKIDLCDLTECILDKINLMHNKNILFGCINPAAIRVVSKDEVYFTDTDNYQIDGFPSMVHNISFMAPELLDKKVYLATKGNEYFAIAELVFMLMMPGKTPYAVGSDEAPEEMIKRMEFPYATGNIYGKNALPGMWRFMWSHLSSLRGCFYNVFQHGGKYNAPENRQDVFYWKRAISYYKKDIQESDDRESLKIYPKTFKRGKGEVFYQCSYCGMEHPSFYFDRRYFEKFKICNSCIDKRSNVSFTCKVCGKTYYYTNRTALFHKLKKEQDSDWQDQKYCWDCKRKTLPCKSCGKEWPFYHLKNGKCPDCNEKLRNTTYKRITCRDCGRQFEITMKDHEFYMSKGFSEPTKCPECRQKRKNSGSSGYGQPSRSNNASNKKKGFFSWLFD